MKQVLLPVTGLSHQYRRIIRDMIRSNNGFSIQCERPKGRVSISLLLAVFHPDDSTVTVSFETQGSLNDENEEAIIKERIRELFDVRYY